MSELGSGSGSSFPGALDTNSTPEVNSPDAGKTKARAEVPNDHSAAIISIETELGTDPAGTLTDVKTFLQTEHNTDGTHDDTIVALLAGQQNFTGVKIFDDVTDMRAKVVWAKGADLASASTLATGTDGNYFDVTGTTTINNIASMGVGTILLLHFDDAVLISHDASNLVLPGGVDITTVTGDEFIFIEYAINDWRMVSGPNRAELLTITDSPATPVANTIYKDNICKAWVSYKGTTTNAILDSFNVDSVDDNGNGDYTVNWDNDFDGVDYCMTGMCKETSGNAPIYPIIDNVDGQAAGTVRVNTVVGTSGTATDTPILNLAVFGDHS